jgi:hypothetical protein
MTSTCCGSVTSGGAADDALVAGAADAFADGALDAEAEGEAGPVDADADADAEDEVDELEEVDAEADVALVGGGAKSTRTTTRDLIALPSFVAGSKCRPFA